MKIQRYWIDPRGVTAKDSGSWCRASDASELEAELAAERAAHSAAVLEGRRHLVDRVNERAAKEKALDALNSVEGILEANASHEPRCLSRESGCECDCWLGEAGSFLLNARDVAR